MSEEGERLGILMWCGHWTDMEKPPGPIENNDMMFCFKCGVQPIKETNVPKPPKKVDNA